jgi:hypothetical protein
MIKEKKMEKLDRQEQEILTAFAAGTLKTVADADAIQDRRQHLREIGG